MVVLCGGVCCGVGVVGGGGGGGVLGVATFLFFFLVPSVFKTLGIPLEQKCPHHFF